MEEESGTSGSELNIDWDLLQPALSRDVDCSVCSSSTTSLPMSSMSPRLSPISIDSNSPYLLRKAGVDKHNVRPGAPSEPNEYNFNYRRRGLFIIINNKNFLPCTGQDVREGTDIDAERLEERFQDMGFEVKRHDDVTSTRLMKIMNEAAAYDHSDCDCFGCAILTHGREGLIYATDRIVPLEALVSPFQRDNCPTLVGKPKLFFIQACRGTKLHRRMDVTDSTSSLDRSSENSEAGMGEIPYRRIPVQADFLFSYSTVPGFYSWRNSQEGSWYIQALCIVMENYGSKMELLHMLTQVNRMVAYDFESCSDEEFTEKEMPSIASMLTRYIYFRPKKPDIRG